MKQNKEKNYPLNTATSEGVCIFNGLEKKILYATAGIILCWMLIYLPAIEEPPIEINEARRIYPAITMLETGNWKTPMFGGCEYFLKPPLMNWMIASSYLISGTCSALAARMTTTLNILFLVLTMLFVPKKLMSLDARFLASLFILTSGGVIQSGRTANIDPNFMCFTGMALIWWLEAWAENSLRYALWLPSAVFITLAALSKGPLVILFFYSAVIPLLIIEKKKKILLSLPHIISIVIIFGIFGIWAWSASSGGTEAQATADASMTGTWLHEIALRFHLNEISPSLWLRRITGGFAQFLPWGIIFFLWSYLARRLKKIDNSKTRTLVKGSIWGIAVPFLLINFMPLTKARYTLPLLPLMSIVSGILIAGTHLKIEVISPKIQKAVKILSLSILVISVLITLVTLFNRATNINLSFIPGTGYSLTLLSAALAVFFILRKLDKECSKLPATIFKACLSAAFIIMTVFIFILPGSSAEEKRCAGLINESLPENSVLHCINYAAREPFILYVKRKKKMTLAMKYLNEKADFLLIEKSRVKYVSGYLRARNLRINSREKLVYKNEHEYYLINLGEKSNKKNEQKQI